MRKIISVSLGMIVIVATANRPCFAMEEGKHVNTFELNEQIGTIEYGTKKIKEVAQALCNRANKACINVKYIVAKPVNYIYDEESSREKIALYVLASALALIAGGYKAYQYYLKNLQQKSLLNQCEIAFNNYWLSYNNAVKVKVKYQDALEKHNKDREKGNNSWSPLRKLTNRLFPLPEVVEEFSLLNMALDHLTSAKVCFEAFQDAQLTVDEAMKAGVRQEVLEKLANEIEQKYVII